MRKLLVIGDTDIFVKRFVEYFSSKDYDVCLLTFGPIVEKINVNVIVMPHNRPYGGLLNIFFARKVARNFSPDLLHVFSGGTDALLGRMLGIRPSVLNVYGTEIFDVPGKSILHKYFIKTNLMYYDQICSTSQMMASRTEKLISFRKSVIVTPFGVDTKEFVKLNSNNREKNTITIGTVKRLTNKYGIDTLIRAFSVVKKYLDEQGDVSVKLLIVGDGSEKQALINLASDLGLATEVEFTGYVPNKLVKNYLNNIDVFVALSRLESESFGVAVVEASAMSIPVVCSHIGGLPDVVKDGETGFLVEVDNVKSAAERILELVLDEDLRNRMGSNGRNFIQSKYSFELNADLLIEVHNGLLIKKV
jgi:glycosyltransferase involved in cell wall biosynthesis